MTFISIGLSQEFIPGLFHGGGLHTLPSFVHHWNGILEGQFCQETGHVLLSHHFVHHKVDVFGREGADDGLFHWLSQVGWIKKVVLEG